MSSASSPEGNDVNTSTNKWKQKLIKSIKYLSLWEKKHNQAEIYHFKMGQSWWKIKYSNEVIQFIKYIFQQNIADWPINWY